MRAVGNKPTARGVLAQVYLHRERESVQEGAVRGGQVRRVGRRQLPELTTVRVGKRYWITHIEQSVFRF